MRPLGEFVAEHKLMTQEEFAQAHPEPALLHRREGDEELLSRLFRTTAISTKTLWNMLNMTHTPEQVVWSVTRRQAGAETDRISVGRAPGSDICLEFPQVSKAHAYFQRRGRSYGLTDVGATNGTFVNDQRLDVDVPMLLTCGATLRFGTHVFTFFTPGGFYRFLRSLTK
jgi:hypothetical protein